MNANSYTTANIDFDGSMKIGSSGGRRTHIPRIKSPVHFFLCHGGIGKSVIGYLLFKKVVSLPGLAPGTPCFARKNANSYTSGTLLKIGGLDRCCPGYPRIDNTVSLLVSPRDQNWMACHSQLAERRMVAARELHPALLFFKQVLSCVS